MQMILLALLVVSSVAGAATPTYYVRNGDKLEKTTKKNATIQLLLKKGDVYKCQQQEVTDKVTMKPFDPEDNK
jgi:hypothetical protein